MAAREPGPRRDAPCVLDTEPPRVPETYTLKREPTGSPRRARMEMGCPGRGCVRMDKAPESFTTACAEREGGATGEPGSAHRAVMWRPGQQAGNMTMRSHKFFHWLSDLLGACDPFRSSEVFLLECRVCPTLSHKHILEAATTCPLSQVRSRRGTLARMSCTKSDAT